MAPSTRSTNAVAAAAAAASAATASAFPKLLECTTTKRFLGLVGKGPFDTCGPVFGKLHDLVQDTKLIHCKSAMLVLCDVPNTSKQDLEWACAVLLDDDADDNDDDDKNSVNIPPGLEEFIVPSGRYATTILRGPYDGLPMAWGDLVMKWIPAQGYQPVQGSREYPHYEVYMNNTNDTNNPEEFETQLFCPIEPAKHPNEEE